MGTWSALGLVALRVARPTAGRTVISVLGATAVNDFMQTTFTYWYVASSKAKRDAGD